LVFFFHPSPSTHEAEQKSFDQLLFYQKNGDFATAANEILNFKNDTSTGSQ
jgi:hypothetical protein